MRQWEIPHKVKVFLYRLSSPGVDADFRCESVTHEVGGDFATLKGIVSHLRLLTKKGSQVTVCFPSEERGVLKPDSLYDRLTPLDSHERDVFWALWQEA